MEIRTNAELARENLTLRHKYKMLKIKYNMVNEALKKVNGLVGVGPLPNKIMKGKNNGHQ